jgi:hypothetical protein
MEPDTRRNTPARVKLIERLDTILTAFLNRTLPPGAALSGNATCPRDPAPDET